jgi:prolipoprotein diacylglyceryltransferase
VLAHLVGEPSRLIAGQSVLGALLGAWIGVEIAKRRIGLRQRTGDDFVLPFAAGLAVGRVGCFLAGVHDGTYGNATALPWGVDFGDGVARHPTQLYETLFLALFVGLLRFCGPALRHQPGLTFRWFAFGYVAWRLLVDALKPVPFAYLGGLSFIQLVCVVALVCVGMELYRSHCTATAART